MTKLAIGICLLCLLTLSAYAQNLPSSGIPAGEQAPQCDEAVTRACRAAADELAAARKLVEAQGAQIKATEDRLRVETERLGLMAEKNQALLEQIEALRQQLEAEKAARAAIAAERDAGRERIAKLERDRQKGRTRTAYAVIIGGVLGVLATR